MLFKFHNLEPNSRALNFNPNSSGFFKTNLPQKLRPDLRLTFITTQQTRCHWGRSPLAYSFAGGILKKSCEESDSV